MILTRRTFAGRVAGLAGFFVGLAPLSILKSVRAQTSPGRKLSFRWRVPAAHYETVENSLTFDGSIEDEHDSKGFPLVFVFIGVALLPSLVDAILTLRRKLVQPGLRIDARGTVITIDVDPALPRGMILLVDKAGATLHEPDQLTDPAELAKALAAATSK